MSFSFTNEGKNKDTGSPIESGMTGEERSGMAERNGEILRYAEKDI